MNVEALAPRALTSQSGLQDDPPSDTTAVQAPAATYALLPACLEFSTKSHGDVSPREAIQSALAPIHRPTPALFDEQVNLQLHV